MTGGHLTIQLDRRFWLIGTWKTQYWPLIVCFTQQLVSWEWLSAGLLRFCQVAAIWPLWTIILLTILFWYKKELLMKQHWRRPKKAEKMKEAVPETVHNPPFACYLLEAMFLLLHWHFQLQRLTCRHATSSIVQFLYLSALHYKRAVANSQCCRCYFS